MTARSTIDTVQFFDRKPMAGIQWRVLLLCAAVLTMDGFDVVAMGFIAPALVTHWHIARAALAPVFSAGLFGLALGAITAGPLADRFGRRRLIIAAVSFFGIMSLLSAFSPTITWLAVLRFLTGFGLGASQPNAVTLASEYAPPKRRAIFVTVVSCGFTAGAAGGGFLSAALIGAYGWPSILIVGGIVPLLSVLLFMAFLPESPRFLATTATRRGELIGIVNKIEPGAANERTSFIDPGIAPRHSGAVRLLFSRTYITPTLMLWTGFFMNLLVVYLLNSWLPIMIRDAGYTLALAATIGAMMQIGGTLGNVSIGYSMDRFGPHVTMAMVLALASLFAVLVGVTFGSSAVIMTTFVFLLGFCINSANTGWLALATLSYPTEIRATGTSVMAGVGRFGAIAGATFGGLLLSAGMTFSRIFVLMTIPIGVAAAAALVKLVAARKVTRAGLSGGRAV